MSIAISNSLRGTVRDALRMTPIAWFPEINLE